MNYIDKIKEYGLEYNFEFNPMQKEALQVITDTEYNLVLASPTASGKTVVAEVSVAKELYINSNSKAIYLSPLKSLTDEKLLDWVEEQHLFNKYSVECITGDYTLTDKKRTALNNADIILMTSEMLDSKSRSIASNNFLHNVNLLVIDEVHLLHMKERGDKLESAIIRFLSHFPDCRLVMISATIPNFIELESWINRLSSRKTKSIKSDYRSVKNNVHYIRVKNYPPFMKISGKNGWELSQLIRKQECIKIIKEIQNSRGKQQVLLFVGNIAFGKDMDQALKDKGYKSEFHSSLLKLEERRAVESRFKNKEIQILVCTTTLAWGVNLPARNVIIAHTAFGMQKMEIIELLQMMGRAGRPGFDTEGDVYILTDKLKKLKNEITDPPPITSRLAENIRFHILCEIANGEVYNQESLDNWYEKTFASVLKINIEDLESILSTFLNNGLVTVDKDGKYSVTILGRIPVMMYFDPLDIIFWYNGIKRVGTSLDIDDDVSISKLIGNNFTWNQTVIVKKMKHLILDCFDNPISQSLYNMVSGTSVGHLFKKYEGLIRKDIDRIIQCMSLIDGFMFHSINKDKLKLMLYRVKYGVKSDKIKLVLIKGIGKVYAEKLYNAGIKDEYDLFSVKNKQKVIATLGIKRYNTLKENYIKG